MGKKCRLIKKCESDNAAEININIPIFANRSKLNLLLFFLLKNNNNNNIHSDLTKYDGAAEININIPIEARSFLSFLFH